MTTEKGIEQERNTINYYGKKVYRINPMLARVKLPQAKMPDFRDDNISEKKVNSPMGHLAKRS